jgi:hypothetical protein
MYLFCFVFSYCSLWNRVTVGSSALHSLDGVGTCGVEVRPLPVMDRITVETISPRAHFIMRALKLKLHANHKHSRGDQIVQCNFLKLMALRRPCSAAACMRL